MTVDDLKEELKKVQDFLEHPEPGLFTWREFLYEKLEHLRSVLNQILKED